MSDAERPDDDIWTTGGSIREASLILEQIRDGWDTNTYLSDADDVEATRLGMLEWLLIWRGIPMATLDFVQTQGD